MTRLYGWGNKSERVNDYVPDVRFERTSIIATLCEDGINVPMTLKVIDEVTLKEFINDDPIETVKASKKSK